MQKVYLLKKNIQEIPDALDKVIQLRGVSFQRTDLDNSEDEGKTFLGLIAQEVEELFPEFISEGKDGMKSVAYGRVVSVLIEAIKELKQEIEELKNVN